MEKIFVPYYGEFIDIKLNPEKHPIAYKNKVDELIKDGMSKEEAEDYVNNTIFRLELIYEKCQGLFAVESEAIESGEIISPFTSKIIEVENEN